MLAILGVALAQTHARNAGTAHRHTRGPAEHSHRDRVLSVLSGLETGLDEALGFDPSNMLERACISAGPKTAEGLTIPAGVFPIFSSDDEALAAMQSKGDYIEDPASLVNEAPLAGLEILFSFGARGGGFEQVQDLAGYFNLPSQDYKTYVDAMVLPLVKGRYVLSGWSESPGCFTDGTAMYSPARSTNWKAWYKAAMTNAKAMIFLVTQAWLDSPNCAEELSWAAQFRAGKPNLVLCIGTAPQTVQTKFAALKGAKIIMNSLPMASSSTIKGAIDMAMADVTAEGAFSDQSQLGAVSTVP